MGDEHSIRNNAGQMKTEFKYDSANENNTGKKKCVCVWKRIVQRCEKKRQDILTELDIRSSAIKLD